MLDKSKENPPEQPIPHTTPPDLTNSLKDKVIIKDDIISPIEDQWEVNK